jgi:predicted nucleic-acid-binding Zn-ribbon protein
MNNEGIKEVKYICKNCGYTEIKKLPPTTIPEPLIHCPQCNHSTFERHDPTYIERMKGLCK